jgi:hypothetical protein
MKVRLTKKLAERIDGINLGASRVGDVLELSEPEARLLIAEDWATPRERRREQSPNIQHDRRTTWSPPLDGF